MRDNKVVMNIKFKHPNLPNAKRSNIQMLRYIATRPGADKSLDVDNYPGDVNCLDTTPHGAFTNHGHEAYDDIRTRVANAKGTVYRMVLSVTEETAKNSDLASKEGWEGMLKSKLPDIAKHMEIKSANLEWTAAVHLERGHPHVHVLFWDKDPKMQTTSIPKSALEDIQNTFSKEVTRREKWMGYRQLEPLSPRFDGLNEKEINRKIKDIRNCIDPAKRKELAKETAKEIASCKTFEQGKKAMLYKNKEAGEKKLDEWQKNIEHKVLEVATKEKIFLPSAASTIAKSAHYEMLDDLKTMDLSPGRTIQKILSKTLKSGALEKEPQAPNRPAVESDIDIMRGVRINLRTRAEKVKAIEKSKESPDTPNF